MDENSKNEYIKNLPKPVQDLVFDNEWEKRTKEIGKKYSLSEQQIDSLADNVLIVLIGLEKPENLLKNITSDLSVSQIIAEQVVEDLENRVFDYALKMIEEKTKTGTSSKGLETKPQNLPMVEKGEGVRVNPPPQTSRDTFKSPIEQAQKPYGVPRFGMNSIPPKVEVINMTQNKPASPQNMMDNKMNMITTNVPEDMQKKEVSSPKIPPTKYNVDPYREPLS